MDGGCFRSEKYPPFQTNKKNIYEKESIIDIGRGSFDICWLQGRL